MCHNKSTTQHDYTQKRRSSRSQPRLPRISQDLRVNAFSQEKRNAAVEIARHKGVKAAAEEVGATVGTVRRWCQYAKVTPRDGRKASAGEVLTEQVTSAAMEASVVRVNRIVQAQTAAGEIIGHQSALALASQRISTGMAARIEQALAELNMAEDTLAKAIKRRNTAEGREAIARAATDVRRAEETKLEARDRLAADIELGRKAAITTGVHIDKVLRLAGEESLQANTGSAVTETGNAAIRALITDPEFRARAIESLNREHRATTSPPVDAEVVG